MKQLFILILVIFTSCNNDREAIMCTTFSNSIKINLKNSSTENILDSDKYPINLIYADYLVNDKIIRAESNAINIYNTKDNNGTHLNFILGLNSSPDEEYPITYLHWNKTETDTLKAQYRRETGECNIIIVEKVWLNGTLVLDIPQEQMNGEITIIK
ncbi:MULTISPECIES: hypothetical protein [unclassified Flavobacterium]|uniref:hypothetical protein n=1 Tax=unclassified Flavobacterium TaxID=196869 RepID=UPI00057F8CBB|nr:MULTISPECIES: hypothetical protein [unclassified Flavobacterium]KIA98808.1 hypothetical protein OA93_07940 [Flavobacterium sp. KMS]MEA9412028.1 hypothetical protein [Flavobacterium sp. PL02]